MRSLRQDYTAATGCKVNRGEIIGAIKWLKGNGLIGSETLALPGTRGRYGKIFEIPDHVLRKDEEMVDVLRAHRLFTFGDIEDYRFSGRKTEYLRDKYTKENYTDNKQWQRGIELNGFQNAAYRTTGQWRFPDRGDPEASVFVPWIVVDIDRTSFPVAHEDLLTGIMDFEAAGFDEDSMYPGFSGSKGFHLILSTGKMGWPIFKNSYDASEVIAEFIRSCTNIEFDLSVCNPLQVYRIAGSRNLKSGLYKKMYTVSEFMNTSLDTIYDNAKNPSKWVQPRKMVDVEDELVEVLRTGANSVLKARLGNKKRSSEKGWNRIGPIISQIINGIDEGDNFGETHTGRHKAAFILACFMLEHPNQLEEVRTRLGVNGRHDFDNPDCAFDTLEYWYTHRTSKFTDEIKLKEPFQSAQRTIARKYGRT